MLGADIFFTKAPLCLESERANQAKNGHRSTFKYMIDVFRVCKASDPHDTIFVLLEIAWKERPAFSTHPRAIVLDYEVSVCNVYTNASKTMLQSYRDLCFLSHVQDARFTTIGNLPSWIPGYSVEAMPTP